MGGGERDRVGKEERVGMEDRVGKDDRVGIEGQAGTAELVGKEDRVGRQEQAGQEQAGEGQRGSESKTAALALRALAHPLRWKLIDLLGSEGSATATRCAEVLSASVASCAYHLGILAKYGYVELVPGQAGREKPWRLASYRQELSAKGLGVEGELAEQAATESFLDHEFARTRERLRSRRLEPAEWREPSRLLGSTMWMTAVEFAQLSDELLELAGRYAERYDDPGSRPPGARLARVFFSTSVAPEPGSARQREG